MERTNVTSATKLKLCVVAVLTAILMLSAPAVAQESESSLDVQVNISEKTIIDIQPKSFSWGEGTTIVNPGSVAGPKEEVNSYGRIQIENLGSVNITQVWFNNSYTPQRPFGTGNPDNYDSGNLIAIDSNSSSTDKNQFVDRKEYGLDQPADEDIVYLDAPNGYDYARFRNASYNYFWAVDDVTGDGTSNLDGATFRIGITPQTETQTGSTTLDSACQYGDESGSNSECNGYTLRNVSDSSGNYWAITEVEVGAADTSGGRDGGSLYCVAMDADKVLADGPEPPLHFIKWNKGQPAVEAAGGGSDCAFATNYTVSSSNALVPGEFSTSNIRAKIPYGTVSAQLPVGDLFVLANSQ